MALTTYSAAITSGGGANVKGSYTQLVASTPYASSRLHVIVRHTGGGVARVTGLVDLATGAAAAETVVVADLAVFSDSDSVVGESLAVSVDVPAGTRLAVRWASAPGSSQVLNLIVLLEDRALGSLAGPVTYGTVSASSRGTLVDPGGVASTKGSYVELAASTSARIDAVGLCCTVNSSITLAAFTTWTLDLATGSGGAESVVIADVITSGNTAGDTMRPGLLRLPVSIPAGTRLAARCACNRTTAGERVLALTVIGLQEPASGGGSAAGAVAYVG